MAKNLLQCDRDSFAGLFNTIKCMNEPKTIKNIVSGLDIGDRINSVVFLIASRKISVSFTRINWSSSSVYVLLLSDITERVLYQNARVQNQCKSKLLQFIPHELQTPTVGIMGCSEALLESKDNIESQLLSKSCQLISQSARKLNLMISAISDYTEMISGVFELRIAEFNVLNTVNEVSNLFETQAYCQGIKFTQRIDSWLPEVILSDSRRLLQILSILISNSLKYTYHGSIELILTYTESHRVKIEVNDSGIGIPRERLAVIQDHLVNHREGNFMFGLQVANRIAKELGRVPLNIHTYKGTQVTFYLDCTPAQGIVVENENFSEQLLCQEGSKLEIPLFKKQNIDSSILIVDDCDVNRAILASLLRKNSLSYLQSKDGLQAVNTVKEMDNKGKPIELIIMDINMPVMDGLEATSQIVQMHQNREIGKKPFIVGYSAYTAPSAIEKCYRVGMISYLKKPSRAKDILKTINMLLKSNQSVRFFSLASVLISLYKIIISYSVFVSYIKFINKNNIYLLSHQLNNLISEKACLLI